MVAAAAAAAACAAASAVEWAGASREATVDRWAEVCVVAWAVECVVVWAAGWVVAWVVVWEAVAVVRSTSQTLDPIPTPLVCYLLTALQLPYTVGWQDLKDLFRQAGMVYRPRERGTHIETLSR